MPDDLQALRPSTFESLPPLPGRGQARIDSLAMFQGALHVGLGAMGREPARILRLDPRGGGWAEVPVRAAPAATASPARRARLPEEFRPGADLALDAAFTGMAVFQGRGDERPCLYVTTASLGGGRLLRSEDGRRFSPVLTASKGRAASLGLGHPTVWGDLLAVTAFAGLADGAAVPGQVLGTSDPRAEPPEPLGPPGFGDRENLEVSALTVAGGRLVAATLNPLRGFQLWSSGAPGESWTRLLGDGAWRFSRNPRVAALASFGGSLVLGTGSGEGEDGELEAAGPELLRIDPDGQWDLIAGEARFTPQGLKVPVSLEGPGFSDPAAREIVPIAGQGRLLVATAPTGELWTSPDGEDWDDPEPLPAPGPVGPGLRVADGLFLAIGGTIRFHRDAD